MRIRLHGDDPLLLAQLSAALVRGGCAIAGPDEDAASLTLNGALALRHGPFLIDTGRAHVTTEGVVRRLSRIETAILTHLARSGGEASRGELIRGVWGYRIDPGTNLVAVHVCRLRAKLGAWAIERTERGYRLAGAAPDIACSAGARNAA